MASAEPISLKQLAAELNTRSSRLLPLIEHGYLKPVPSPNLKEVLVEKPPPGAIVWLRNMLLPLKRKPLIPLKNAAEIMEMPPPIFRRYLLHYNLQAHMDPVFGELVSLQTIYDLKASIIASRDELRVDAQQIFVALVKVAGIRLKPFPYIKRLDDEIVRISKLEQPLRALRAAALIEAWKSADSVAACIKGYQENCVNPIFAHADELDASKYEVDPPGRIGKRRRRRKRLGITGAAAGGVPSSGA